MDLPNFSENLDGSFPSTDHFKMIDTEVSFGVVGVLFSVFILNALVHTRSLSVFILNALVHTRRPPSIKSFPLLPDFVYLRKQLGQLPSSTTKPPRFQFP